MRLSKRRFNNRQKPTFNENWRGCRKSSSTIAKNQLLTKTGEVVEKTVQQSPKTNLYRKLARLSKKRFNNRQKTTFNENWRGCRKSGSTIAKN